MIDAYLNVPPARSNLGLYGGWAGLGWIATHLDAEDDFVGTHVDSVLTSALTQWPPRLGYDLISGLVGAGVYFVERFPKASAIRGLGLVLDALDGTASKTEDGITWFTGPEYLPAWQRERAPNGYFNLGVAHGVPGVCSLLGRIVQVGIGVERAGPLLLDSLCWLRANHPSPESAELPSWIAPGVDPEPNQRVAWCYGPLGASAVALEAAKIINDRESARWARELALACANVPVTEASIRDAGLCHGAAGNAHIFQRLYWSTGDRGFLDAARMWLRAVIDYRRPGEGFGGYRMWGDLGGNRQGWVEDASFLTGSAGVGLVLLTATTGIEPRWDRLLLLS